MNRPTEDTSVKNPADEHEKEPAGSDADEGPEGSDPASPGDVPAGAQYGGSGDEQ